VPRPLSRIAPDWWDYTTLDAEIIRDAAALTDRDVTAYVDSSKTARCAVMQGGPGRHQALGVQRPAAAGGELRGCPAVAGRLSRPAMVALASTLWDRGTPPGGTMDSRYA
jgi:hypothetical protein